MSLPITQIIKDLESPDTVIPILKTLKYNISKLHELPKSELKHLISRTLNLTASHEPFKKWCGIVIIQTIVMNYGILSNHGKDFFNALIKVLETSHETKVVNSCIDCLNVLCHEIRGKPTLTREILTPKLPIIIPLYMDRIEKSPRLILKSLSTIIINHPTTFRPFGNKLNNKLIELLNSEFNSFDKDLKIIICQTFSILPIIEKTEPEVMWYNKLTNVINETVDTLSIFKQLINIDQDKELSSLFTKFKLDSSIPSIFPHLQIDLSASGTIVQVSNRLEILILLISSFLTTQIKFASKIPIGKVITVIELIFNLNTRFLPFKRDIIDESVKNIINSIILNIQFNTLDLLNVLIDNYQGVLIMYLNNLLSILETSIPLTNKLINADELIKNEIFYCRLLEVVTNLLSLVSIYSEPSTIVRFVDASLTLVEPRQLDLSITEKNGNGSGKNSNKRKNKNSQAVPMADLLSHGHLFNSDVPSNTIKVVRRLINCIISRIELPANQYYKIMRYLVLEAIKCKQYNYNKSIPNELKDLLVSSIIYPGFEKISILPIISSIMGNDPLLSIFNNPRFPPLPVFIRNSTDQDYDMEEIEEPIIEINEQKRVQLPDDTPKKRVKLDGESTMIGGDATETRVAQTIEVQDESKIFKPVEVNPETVMKFKQPEPTSVEKPLVDDTIMSEVKPSEPIETKHEPEPEEDGSDFEMPEIDIDADSDED